MVGFQFSSVRAGVRVLPYQQIGPCLAVVSEVLLWLGAVTRRPDRVIRALATAGRWSRHICGPIPTDEIELSPMRALMFGATSEGSHPVRGFGSWTKD